MGSAITQPSNGAQRAPQSSRVKGVLYHRVSDYSVANGVADRTPYVISWWYNPAADVLAGTTTFPSVTETRTPRTA